MRKERNGTAGMSWLGGILSGAGTGVLVMLLGSLILAWLMDSEKVNEEAMGYGVLAGTMLSALSGCGMGIRLIKHHRLAVSAATAAAFFAILLGITGLFFEGQYQGIGVTFLVVAGCALGAALAGMNKKTRGKSRSRKRLNR